MALKYSEGQRLYYSCPISFIVDKVKIQMVLKEDDSQIYYIDHIGAYLKEEDLFDDLNDAKARSIENLNSLYHRAMESILHLTERDFDEVD